jgi:flagellar protein FliJ
MKKYQFRLEAVLKVRKMEEELSRNKLGLLMVEKQKIQDEISEIEKRIDSSYLEQETHLIKGMNAAQAAFFPMLVDGSHSKIKELTKKLEQQDSLIEAQKKVLSQKRADLKLMENLNEKEFVRWKKEYNKLVDKNVEEMVQLWDENRKGLGE